MAIRTAAADPITLMWDPNPPEDGVLGYQVLVGNAFGFFAVYDVGDQIVFVYPDAVAGQEYMFAVEAYNELGLSPHAELSAFSNAPPDLVNPGVQVSAVGEPVALQLYGSDRYGDLVSYRASGLPPGLTLTESTGLIAGAGTTTGIYDVTVTGFDGVLYTPQSLTWFIDSAPPTVAITLPTAQPTYSINVGAIALGGTVGDDLGIASVTWVNNLGGAGTATVTTPTTWQIPAVPLAAGDNVITVTVRDVANYTTADVLTVTSTGAGVPVISIGLPTSAPSFVTSANTIALGGTATDGAAVTSVTWTTDRGGSGTAQLNTLQGVTFWNVAVVPLQPGTNVITATASNASGNSGTAVLTVERLNNPPALNDPGNRDNAEGDVVSLQLAGSDSDGDSITYTAAGLPPGLTLNQSSGLISGILPYTAAGVYSTTLAVLDSTSTTLVSPMWTVTNTNRAPVMSNPGSQGAFQGVGIALAMSAVDEDNDPLTWIAQNLPPGVAINPSTGMLSGTPTTLGTFTTSISASDASATAQASFAWIVASPLPGPASPASPSGITGTATPAFSWPGVPLATYFALSITDAGAASPILVWHTPAQAGCAGGAGTCAVAAPRALAGGLVSWKVLTWNPYGYGPWSATMNTVVDLADASVPTPTAVGPSGFIGTRTPTYSWHTIGNATWYQVAVTDALGTAREFWYTSAVACDTTPCGETPNALLAIGPAQWRVRAWRGSGAGPWTALVNFEAVDAAPGKATLVSPTAVSSATPAFTWNAVLGTSYYLLRVSDRDNINIERWYRPVDAGCPLGTGICTGSLGTAINPGPANWLVLTWNGSGYGPWSDPRNFSVEVPDPSAATPATIGPTGLISSPNATYRWTAVAGVSSYRLSIRNNGGAPTHWWYTPAGAGCAAAVECSVTPQAGLQNGTAEWQVQAWTPNGHSAWSAPIALTVNIGAPAKPNLVSPSGPATAAPTFVWNASANATLYYIRANDVTGLRVDRWLTPAQAGCPSGAGACALDGGVTLNSGTGSWQVIAWNPSGYSPWSSTLGFVVP